MKKNRDLGLVAALVGMFLLGCGQSALDACTDSKSYLWNVDIEDNRYEGNEAYWDAIAQCRSRYE